VIAELEWLATGERLASDVVGSMLMLQK